MNLVLKSAPKLRTRILTLLSTLAPSLCGQVRSGRLDAWQGVGKHAGRRVWMSGRDHKDKMCLYRVKTWEFTRLVPNPN